jgi:hypothetical protein
VCVRSDDHGGLGLYAAGQDCVQPESTELGLGPCSSQNGGIMGIVTYSGGMMEDDGG